MGKAVPSNSFAGGQVVDEKSLAVIQLDLETSRGLATGLARVDWT